MNDSYEQYQIKITCLKKIQRKQKQRVGAFLSDIFCQTMCQANKSIPSAYVVMYNDDFKMTLKV